MSRVLNILLGTFTHADDRGDECDDDNENRRHRRAQSLDGGADFIPYGARRMSAPPALASQSALSPADLREQILRLLTKAVQELVAQGAKSPDAEEPPDDPGQEQQEMGRSGLAAAVAHLCMALEQACLHGIKTKEFHGQAPFWDLLEHLAMSKKDCPPAVLALVMRLREDTTLLTPLGRARSLIRLALNEGCADQMVSWLTTRPAELKRCYGREALLLHAEDLCILLTSLQFFRLSIPDCDDPALDQPVEWPLLPALQSRQSGLEAEHVPVIRFMRDLAAWKLEDVTEVSTLEAFKHENGAGSFNSWASRRAELDPFLNGVLEAKSAKVTSVQAAESEGEEDDAVICVQSGDFLLSPATPKRKKGAKLIGEALELLVKDVETCRFAYLSPDLGVPFIFEEMIDFCERHLDGNGLFGEGRVSGWRMSGLQHHLEEFEEVPEDTDPHVAAATLVVCLRMLPEPLLTYSRYHAFLACARIEDRERKLAVLRGLIMGLPMTHRPTLASLMRLWRHTSWSEGQLAPQKLAEVVCPGLLRTYVPDGYLSVSQHESEAQEVVQTMIEEYEELFGWFKEESETKLLAMQSKVIRLESTAEEAKHRVAVDDKDAETIELLTELYSCLARVDQRIEKSRMVCVPAAAGAMDDFGCSVSPREDVRTLDLLSAEPASPEMTGPCDLYAQRWETCGFIRGDPVCEVGSAGKLTLRCLVYLFINFPDAASEMTFQYALHGRKGITASFPNVCGQVMRLMLPLLRLAVPPGRDRLTIAAFSEAAHWRLLDDLHAVEEVYCMALLLLDFLHYHESISLEDLPVYLLEVKRQLSWALALGPVSMDALWGLFAAMSMEGKRRFRRSCSLSRDDESAVENRPPAAAGPDMGMRGVLCTYDADEKGRKFISKTSKGGTLTLLTHESDIMRPAHVALIEAALPESYQDYHWLRLYSLKRHGASLKTLYERCRNHGRSILVVMDGDGTVFGGFTTDPWRDNKEKYYGSGESFLFTFREGRFIKYSWTRANSYHQFANMRGLAMGGGGHFGLFLDQDLLHGSSGACSTFGSSCLSQKKTFEIVALEVWGFEAPLGRSVKRQSSTELFVRRDRANSLVETLQHADLESVNIQFSSP